MEIQTENSSNEAKEFDSKKSQRSLLDRLGLTRKSRADRYMNQWEEVLKEEALKRTNQDN